MLSLAVRALSITRAMQKGYRSHKMDLAILPECPAHTLLPVLTITAALWSGRSRDPE